MCIRDRTFTVFPSVIASAAGLFLGIFLLILVANTMRVSLVNPIELLRGGQTGEKEPKTNWPLTIIGILMLGLGSVSYTHLDVYKRQA